MARFKLDPDERVISTHAVTLVERGTKLAATIYLTTQRLVVAGGDAVAPAWGFVLNPFGMLFRAVMGKRQERISYQMRRDAFASIEKDGDLIVFHDHGEGYAHVSFAITPDVFAFTPESFDVWQQRITEWAPARDE